MYRRRRAVFIVRMTSWWFPYEAIPWVLLGWQAGMQAVRISKFIEEGNVNVFAFPSSMPCLRASYPSVPSFSSTVNCSDAANFTGSHIRYIMQYITHKQICNILKSDTWMEEWDLLKPPLLSKLDVLFLFLHRISPCQLIYYISTHITFS